MRSSVVFGSAALTLCSHLSIGLASPSTEFWAVYSDDEANFSSFSIVVSNPDLVRTASVVIEDNAGVVASASVAAGERRVFDMGLSRMVSRTTLAPNAYRVRSDIPVHAHQFHDYDTSITNTTGSLLPSRSLLGTSYIVLTMAEPRGQQPSRPSFVAIVAPEASRVTVTVSVPTQAGGSVPALNAGDSVTIDLQAFDVLQIAGIPTADMTGTRVVSTAPVEVFAGCLNCHIGSSAAENVEELQIPLAHWATEVVAVSSSPMTSDTNIWRILAAQDGTTVSTDPLLPGMPTTLDAGRFVQLSSAADFVVSASSPVLVGRFNTTTSSVDPALCLMAPLGLFVLGGTFALSTRSPPTPLCWIDVVALPGTTVTVDGNPIAGGQFLPVGSSLYLHARVALGQNGEFHRVESDCAIGLYAGIVGAETTASFAVDLSPNGGAPPELGASYPLLLAKRGSGILFSWEDLGPGMTYNVYEGVLRGIWSHVPIACAAPGAPGPPGRRSGQTPPSTGRQYYLMTASNCIAEGPSGADPSLSACPP